MFIDFSHLKLFRGLCSQLREVDSPGQQDRRHFGDAVNLKSVGDAHNLVIVMLLGMLVYIFLSSLKSCLLDIKVREV